VALYIFVIGDRKNFKCDVQVECASHSPLSSVGPTTTNRA